MGLITGTHAAIHSTNAIEDVRVLRNILELDAFDVGGTVIFRLPRAELHAHPSEEGGGVIEFYLTCRDVEEFVRSMRENNVSCSPVQNLGWGLMTDIELPGGATLGIYQPTYPVP